MTQEFYGEDLAKYKLDRATRRLEMETRRNLEVIWLLKKLTPDHKKQLLAVINLC